MVDSMVSNPHDGVSGFVVKAEIWKRGRLISTGINALKTHPLQKQFGRNPMAIHRHAEIDALRNALNYVQADQLTKCTLYVARIKRLSKGGRFVRALAKPCEGCMRMVSSFEFKEVFWTTDTGDNVF